MTAREHAPGADLMTEKAARVRRAGDAALLVETGDLGSAHRLHAAVRAAALPGVVDVVPGGETVLVTVDPRRSDLDRLAASLTALPLPERDETEADLVEVPVTYDGADLDAVADLTGLSREEVVARHVGGAYVVAYLGFAPGFAYVTGLDPRLHLPRRATPRTSVPAGSVAIAGPYTAVYPAPSPGGWHLLGHTGLGLWDTHRDPPARLQPGTRVRFTPSAEP